MWQENEKSRLGARPGRAIPPCVRPAGSTLGGVSGERGRRGTTERKVPAHSDCCGQYRCPGRSTRRDRCLALVPPDISHMNMSAASQTCDLQKLQVAPLTVPLFLEGRYQRGEISQRPRTTRPQRATRPLRAARDRARHCGVSRQAGALWLTRAIRVSTSRRVREVAGGCRPAPITGTPGRTGANRQGLACSSGRPRRRRPRLRASVAGRAPRRPWTSDYAFLTGYPRAAAGPIRRRVGTE